ncbi:MAG: response regulator [Deltaproteobacteria bacterium]|nr:response regulator [Deltaproteobacteria bacterium]
MEAHFGPSGLFLKDDSWGGAHGGGYGPTSLPCEQNPAPAAEPIRVLVVDDEPDCLRVLAKRLGRYGCQVTALHSGEAALRALRKEAVQVAVLDLHLHDLDGLEVLRLCRRLSPDLPVIILTGGGSEQLEKEGRLLGAVAYLEKPVSGARLWQSIQAALSPTASAAATEPGAPDRSPFWE